MADVTEDVSLVDPKPAEAPAPAPAPAPAVVEEANSAPNPEPAANSRPPNPDNVGKPKKLKYRKAYIIFGYTGTGYSGIQRNPGVKSLEDELFNALTKAGLINPGDDLQARRRLDWTRSARTDKGVHAAANMVGCKLLEPVEGFGVAAARMNEHMPPQVRVYTVQRTVKSFSAQHAAGGRQYEYLLPTFVLKPVGSGQIPLAKPPTMPALRKGETPLPRVPGNTTTDPFATGQAQAAGRAQAWAARAAAGGGHSVFKALPAVPRDPAVTAAPSTELWDGSSAPAVTGLADPTDSRPSIHDTPAAATGAGAATEPSAPTGGVKREREEAEEGAAPVGGVKRGREGEEEETGDAKAARTEEAAAPGGAKIIIEDKVVLRMTKGWTFNQAKYTYLASIMWKHRFQRRATARDLIPDAPRPGTAAYHNPHTAPVSSVTYVAPPGPARAAGSGDTASVVGDPFANGSAAKAAREQMALVRGVEAQKAADALAASKGGLDPHTLSRLREAAQQLLGTKFFHNFTPRMNAGDAATQRTLYSIDVSDPFMVEGTQYVRITLRGQSFILNQIRHMVAAMADYARGVMPAFLMKVVFSRNTKMMVPLAPATGLFLHNPEFPHFNRKHGETYGPILFDEGTPIREQVEAFKKEVVYPHMHVQMSGDDNPFVEFLKEYSLRNFYRCSYADTCPTSTHASKTAMKEYVHRSFGSMAREMGKGAARATVSGILRTQDKDDRDNLFQTAKGAAQRSKRAGRGKGRRRW